MTLDIGLSQDEVNYNGIVWHASMMPLPFRDAAHIFSEWCTGIAWLAAAFGIWRKADAVPPQVLIPAPYWTSYPEMARLARSHPVILDCPASEGYLLTAQQLRAALTPQSRLLILCTPSNPSGAVYSLQRLQVLISNSLRSRTELRWKAEWHDRW